MQRLNYTHICTIQNFKQIYPKYNWDKIKSKIDIIFPEIAHWTKNELKEYYKNQNPDNFIKESLDLWKEQANGISMINFNPNNFLYNHKGPGQIIKNGKWSVEETELFKELINDGISNKTISKNGPWGIFSLRMPYRTGYQCLMKYKQLKNKNILPELPEKCKIIKEYSSSNYRAFSKHQEEVIAEQISTMINEGIGLTMQNLKELFMNYFYDSHVMAARSAEIVSTHRGILMYDNDGYKTKEFCMIYNEMLDIAINEPQKLIEITKLPNFSASSSFILNFLDEYGFSFKTPHIKRRGAIKEKSVNEYIQKINKAIEEYGEENIFNMDETSICNAYYPKKVVGIIGSEYVPLYTNLNVKESFTALMTCSKVKIFPPIIIAKGLSERCTNKFKIDNCKFDYQVWFSKDGWTNEDIMIKYLNFLNSIHPDKCALILDSFRAHMTQKVKEYASTKNINIIQVPSNGTGAYQPLDRKIFGIVKAKLRKDIKEKNCLIMKDRWKLSLFYLLRAWNEINLHHLNSAWDIPGLFKNTAPCDDRDDFVFLDITEKIISDHDDTQDL